MINILLWVLAIVFSPLIAFIAVMALAGLVAFFLMYIIVVFSFGIISAGFEIIKEEKAFKKQRMS